jgi:Tfp pilus assembly protein PilF
VYLRGLAYLQQGQGEQAAAEFQKMLNHRGVVLNLPTAALAHLQLARAEAMSGNRAAAQKSYDDFLALWKAADPDLPLLKQAQSESAKVR